MWGRLQAGTSGTLGRKPSRETQGLVQRRKGDCGAGAGAGAGRAEKAGAGSPGRGAATFSAF